MIDEPNRSKKSILIVDDEDDLLFLYSIAIRMKDGYEVTGMVKNGQEAMEFLEKQQSSNNLPEIILMDHRMPVMDGLTAIKKIRKKFADSMLIVLTTADHHAIQLAKKKQMKIDGYLQKPFELKAIREIIDTITQVVLCQT